jgi:NAD(P)-dependent dehydrogenase (short-subunit alcohol dehydrogenase family)
MAIVSEASGDAEVANNIGRIAIEADIGISEALQYELPPIGVRVKVVEPGAIQTTSADVRSI